MPLNQYNDYYQQPTPFKKNQNSNVLQPKSINDIQQPVNYYDQNYNNPSTKIQVQENGDMGINSDGEFNQLNNYNQLPTPYQNDPYSVMIKPAKTNDMQSPFNDYDQYNSEINNEVQENGDIELNSDIQSNQLNGYNQPSTPYESNPFTVMIKPEKTDDMLQSVDNSNYNQYNSESKKEVQNEESEVDVEISKGDQMDVNEDMESKDYDKNQRRKVNHKK